MLAVEQRDVCELGEELRLPHSIVAGARSIESGLGDSPSRVGVDREDFQARPGVRYVGRYRDLIADVEELGA